MGKFNDGDLAIGGTVTTGGGVIFNMPQALELKKSEIALTKKATKFNFINEESISSKLDELEGQTSFFDEERSIGEGFTVEDQLDDIIASIEDASSLLIAALIDFQTLVGKLKL